MALKWWQGGIVYQVYPRSFQDSDGDGTGDLRGIRQRLGHLVRLGVDALWISPVYPSPMTDFGYDVAEYCDIDPIFGTLADFDGLVGDAHLHGLKVILDFVPNHTSDRHAWFQDSRARRGGREDWYLWRDAAPGGGPPNNWLANFGGPAWSWDAVRGQYYGHSFLPTQPDLNWRNAAVRAAMTDVLRFWLDRGVDGFRVDVMWMMIKDELFRDNPPDPEWREGWAPHARFLPVYTTDRPEVMDVVAEMRGMLDAYPGDRVLIGELYLPVDRLVAYYGTHGEGAHLPFNFLLVTLRDWTAEAVAALVRGYEAALPAGAWPNWVLGNHDQRRVASRLGAGQARVAALLLLTLRGTPTIYMGEELGMTDTVIPGPELRDPAELREPGRGLGRDPQRTPMPWTAGPGGGFTTGVPWLRLGTDTPCDAQEGDPGSMLALYRRLIALRRAQPALTGGAIGEVEAEGGVLRYVRSLDGVRIAVALNLTAVPAGVDLPVGGVLEGTHPDRVGQQVDGRVALRPDEAVVVAVRTPGAG